MDRSIACHRPRRFLALAALSLLAPALAFGAQPKKGKAPAKVPAAAKPAKAEPSSALGSDLPRAVPAPSPAIDPAAPVPAKPAVADGPPNPYLLEAKELYSNLQFDGILPKLEFALAVKGITPAQKVEIFKLMAFTFAAFDDASKAETAFLKLLEIEPKYELSGASPKIRDFFANAQKTWKAMQAVKLQHVPPQATTAGVTTSVDVQVSSGRDRVKSMTLHYRARAEENEQPGPYSQIGMSEGENGAWSAPVPNVFPGPAGRRKVEYFVRARGAANELLASIADEMAPLQMEVDAVPYAPRPIYKSPWFWGGVAAAVGAGIATPFLLNRDAKVQPGSLGKEGLR